MINPNESIKYNNVPESIKQPNQISYMNTLDETNDNWRENENKSSNKKQLIKSTY